jgi:lipopolysaccharide export system protein LptC
MAVHLYTRYVKILRLVLPAVAVISLLGLLVWPFWREHRQNNEAADDLAKSQQHQPHAAPTSGQTTPTAAPLQVIQPDYQGLDNQGRPYRITASRVEQNLNPKAPILLVDPSATLILSPATETRSERSLTLKAMHGLYDAQAQTLDLKGAVNLLDDQGYVITAQDLVVDLARFYAMTTTPVTGEGPQGTLSAQSLNIADKGAVIVLKGPSRLVFQPADPKPPALAPVPAKP